MINLVVGLIFILLLYSLLATTVMEIIASVFSMRGRNLERALGRLLFSSKDSPIFQEFTGNPLYQQIQSRFFRWQRPPSYMSNQTFSTILFKTLFTDKEGNPNVNIAEQIESIRNPKLRQALQHFHAESFNDTYVFRRKVETWYDEVMDRAGGWYKRNTQFILLVVGIFIAVIFNVDTIAIYDKLSKDPQAQLELLDLTNKYFADSKIAEMQASELGMDYQQQVNSLLTQNLQSIKDPVGMGWDGFSDAAMPNGLADWLYRILGWLTTALAVSLGAPFWFDLLKKLVNVRSSGSVPPVSNQIPPYEQIPTSYGLASRAVAQQIVHDIKQDEIKERPK